MKKYRFRYMLLAGFFLAISLISKWQATGFFEMLNITWFSRLIDGVLTPGQLETTSKVSLGICVVIFIVGLFNRKDVLSDASKGY